MTHAPTLKLAIAGASGRMGRTLIAAVREANKAALVANAPPYWELSGALSFSQSEVDGVPCTPDRDAEFSGADVVIDFSHGSQFEANLRAAVDAGAACLIGTTALPPEAQDDFYVACEKVPVMHAPNASITVAVLSELVAKAAYSLPDLFDIEILDFHHAAKLDAPSGTALELADVAQDARRRQAPPHLPSPKIESTSDRQGPRERGTIHTASLRGGTVAGEHRVIFAGPGERLELHYIAQDRTAYARGALFLARMLVAAPPDNYTARTLTELTRRARRAPLD